MPYAILSFPEKQYVSLTFCIPQMGHVGECSRDTPFVRRVCKSLGPLEASKLKYEAVHQRHLKHANLHLKIQTSNLSFSRGDKCTQPNSLLKTVNCFFTVVAFFCVPFIKYNLAAEKSNSRQPGRNLRFLKSASSYLKKISRNLPIQERDDAKFASSNLLFTTFYILYVSTVSIAISTCKT